VQSAGIEDQDAHKKFFVIKDTIRVENNGSWAQVSPHEGFKVTLEIDSEFSKSYKKIFWYTGNILIVICKFKDRNFEICFKKIVFPLYI
jgi:UDP-3-O-acyl-N-acetylglucosamine deacetylase